MTNHPAALLSAAKSMRVCALDPRAMEVLETFAELIVSIATDLEKAQAEPVLYQYLHTLSDGSRMWTRDLFHNGVETKESRPLFAAQPPAIPISPPQEWVDFLLDDSSDKGNCSLAEFCVFANRAWEKMRSILEATEPKAVVAEGFAVVPLIPTEDMLGAGCDAIQDTHRTGNWGECPGVGWGASQACYEAMLAAAPNPKAVPQVDPYPKLANQETVK